VSVELPPFVEWEDFFARWRWHAGEHVTVIGPTGTGKTTVMRALLPKRYEAGGSVCVVGTKTRDTTLSEWAKADGLTRISSWPPKLARLVVEPPGRRRVGAKGDALAEAAHGRGHRRNGAYGARGHGIHVHRR